MATLVSGTYEPDNTVSVYVWPKPDADGDGADVFIDQIDEQGRNLGRNRQTDAQGRPVKRYNPPTGFINVASFDGTENYVYSTDGRTPYRDPDGSAVPLREGEAVVIRADGTAERLHDDWEQAQFAKAHTLRTVGGK